MRDRPPSASMNVDVPACETRHRTGSGPDIGIWSIYRLRDAKLGSMGRLSTDDQLLGRLLAPPDLDSGVESLDYWHRRCRRLSWWRIRARREAVRMTILWEQRVGAALVSQHWTPLEIRSSAAVLIARTRLARWSRRAGIAVLAVVTTVLVVAAVQIAAALEVLFHAL
jgi:hypothetical protein